MFKVSLQHCNLFLNHAQFIGFKPGARTVSHNEIDYRNIVLIVSEFRPNNLSGARQLLVGFGDFFLDMDRCGI